jgi:hypothetical protein
MTHHNSSTILLLIKGRVSSLLPFFIILLLGSDPVVADGIPMWDPFPDIGCNIAGQDVVNEISVPANDASFYLNQLTSFSCTRAVDRDRRTAGGSTSYYTDAMASSGYPDWSCNYGSFPNGHVGTSVNWRASSTPAVDTIRLAEDDVPSPVPPNERGSRGDADRFVDTRTVYSVGVDTLTWNYEGEWVVTYEADPLYVLKDTPVLFRAFKTPYQAADWPSGKPVWGGSAGASGTGETKTVTFSTKSNSLTDYKTVTVECGNVVTVNVVVYTLHGILTPFSWFYGRSNYRYGLEEFVNLSYSTDPNGIFCMLEWIKTSGVGQVYGWSYDAKDATGEVTLKLQHTYGPSKGLGPSYSRTVVAPSGTRMTKTVGHENSVWHIYGEPSAGIELNYWLDPKDVSFSKLTFGEGS